MSSSSLVYFNWYKLFKIESAKVSFFLSKQNAKHFFFHFMQKAGKLSSSFERILPGKNR
jgi:hypothetical protein